LKQSREYALSLKQPWATLLVYGLKTIEIRRWPTARRGRVLIHASSVADTRQEGWNLLNLLPEELREKARLGGGIVGAGEIMGCVAYRTLEAFAADQEKHRNEPSWFEGPLLYGFVFANVVETPFCAYPGWMRFFPVEAQRPRRKGS
jgi:hypothetical protein